MANAIRILLLMGLLVLSSNLHAAEVSIMGLFHGKAALLINGQQAILSEGEVVDGVKLLSANSEQAVMLIDGQRVIQTLGSSLGIPRSPSRDAKQSVTIRADEQGMYRVTGKVNNRRVEFLVDTGATMVALSRDQADRLKLRYDMAQATMATTAGGEVKAFPVILDKLKVGAIVKRNVDAVVLDGSYPPQPLLGNSFLNLVEMTRRQKKLVLTAE